MREGRDGTLSELAPLFDAERRLFTVLEQSGEARVRVAHTHASSVPAPRAVYSRYPDALFLDIGRCEQPGGGWQGIDWAHRGSYNGGLGMLNVNWSHVAWELGLPDPAYLASPAQQIEGARRLAEDVGGLNGWGCYNAHHAAWGY